jgi:hypothetical protein
MSTCPDDCNCCSELREAKDLLLGTADLIDDLMFCVKHPDKNPCKKRKSKRTREMTMDDALEVRDILWDCGGRS